MIAELTTWTGRFAVIDVETTGVDPKEHRVVEIAAVVVLDGAINRRWSSLLNPGTPIPAEASAVNGITDAMVKDAPTFAEIAIDLAQLVDDLPIAAYNEPFDRAFVGAEWTRADLQPVVWLAERARWIDPLVWAREAQKYCKGKKLGDVAARLGVIQPDGAHRALADAITAAEVLLAFRRTRAWADWRRRNGADPRDFFPGQWGACIRAQEARRARQEEEFKAWRAKQPQRETGT